MGKKTCSPLLILSRGKSKHTKINKAVNHPAGPCHQVPTKPRWQKVSAEGRGPPGPVPCSPPWGLVPSPAHHTRVPGVWGHLLGGVLSLHSPFLMVMSPWQQDLSLAGPTAPRGDGGDMGLCPGGVSPWGLPPPRWVLVDKGKPTEEEEAASIARGIARAGLRQDRPAAPISPLCIST